MVRAQSTLWLDAAVSSARPPAGAPQTETTNYGILGAHGETFRLPLKITGNVSGGWSLEGSGGQWLWLQSDVEHPYATLGGYWLEYNDEADYTANGLQLRREFKAKNDALTLRPVLALAHWRTERAWSVYLVGGGGIEWNRTIRDVWLRLNADTYLAGKNGFASGAYASIGADAFYVFRGTTFGAGVRQGFDPLDAETGFSLWAGREVNENLRVDVQLVRTVTDALFGTPGSRGLTISGSWRFLHRAPVQAPVLAEVGEAAGTGRIVKFTVQAPDSARSVAVSGTFSDWRPIALTREGKTWRGTVTVAAGTHQYGFLLNGKDWFVPADAAEVIDDGFGRKNVTLVVRPK